MPQPKTAHRKSTRGVYGNFDNIFGPFLAKFSAPAPPTVHDHLERAHADWVLIGAWNPMLCPIWGFRSRGASRQSLRSPGSPRPGTQALRQASLRPPGHLSPEPSAAPGSRQQPSPGRGRGRGELPGPAGDDADFIWQQAEAGGVAPSAVSTVVEDTEDDEEPRLYVGAATLYDEGTADPETPSRKNRLSARASTSI